jgi:hypothetical protein
MDKMPDDLSPVGWVIERHRLLSYYEETDPKGKTLQRGYRSYGRLAFAANIHASYLSRILYGEKLERVNSSVWRNLAIALAHGKVRAGKCRTEAIIPEVAGILVHGRGSPCLVNLPSGREVVLVCRKHSHVQPSTLFRDRVLVELQDAYVSALDLARLTAEHLELVADKEGSNKRDKKDRKDGREEDRLWKGGGE